MKKILGLFLLLPLSVLAQNTTTMYYRDSQGRIVQSVTTPNPVLTSPYAYRIPDRTQQVTNKPREVSSPIRISDTYVLREPRDGMSADYYKTFNIIRGFVLQMANMGIDVTTPNFSEPGGGDLYKQYLNIINGLRREENLTPEQRIQIQRNAFLPKFEEDYFMVLSSVIKRPYKTLGKTEFELHDMYDASQHYTLKVREMNDNKLMDIHIGHALLSLVFSPETKLTYAILMASLPELSISKIKEHLEFKHNVVFDRFGRSQQLKDELTGDEFYLDLITVNDAAMVRFFPVDSTGARLFYKK